VKDEPKIRIVVRKAHGGGHHGGAWKVAYADFVTTLMALFIVLWIVGQSSTVRLAIAGYFRDPGAFKEGRAPAAAPGGAGILPGQAPEAGQATPADPDGEAEERALRAAAERIRALTASDGPFAPIAEQIDITVTAEGLRIELREHERRPFFEVGSAVLIHPLKPLLEQLQAILGALPNHVTVEGHTDGRPYSARKDYSNWELSADRANSARRVLENAGLRVGQVDRVVGHADRMPVTPDDPLHASNRRISLLVRRERAPAEAHVPSAASGAVAGVPSSPERSFGVRAAAAEPVPAGPGTSPAAAPRSEGAAAAPPGVIGHR
jgi:chemotaxis protein MotB